MTSKVVWILNHYAQEPGGAGGIRHYGLASNLHDYGWSASIIAASIEHTTGRQRLKGLALRKLQEVAGVGWLWLRTPGYRGNGIGRIFNMAVYTVVALLPGMMRGLPRPDVIIGSSVHPFAAWSGALLAWRYRVPFVFEVRDLWPSTLIDMGQISPSGLSANLFFRLESWLAKRAALTIVLMPRAAEYYQALGIDVDRIMVLPNGTDASAEMPSAPIVDGGDFTLMYCGAMGSANSLETLIDALALVERDWDGPGAFKCRLIGDGPVRIELEAQSIALELKSVRFEPPVPKAAVASLLLEADAFVITVKDIPRLYRFGVSMNKIFDYMAAGRPVVMAAAVPENPVVLSGGGVVVLPESPVELAEAILGLANTEKTERDDMGLKGWQYVLENHHYRKLSGRLATALDGVVAERGKAS